VLAVCGFLLLAVALVFGQTVCHEFVNFDDDVLVYENPQVPQGLTVSGIAWAFAQPHGSNWIPLTWLSFMLDSQLYGLNAGGFHLTNGLLHAATTIILFLVLWQMTGDFWPSALVAAVFGVHPLRVESVAWVTERKDVLSGLFFMLTLGAYLDYVRHRPSLLRYLAATVFFVLGLMAKSMLVTLPFVLLLLDYWPLGRFADIRRPQGNEGTLLNGAGFLETILGRFPRHWRLVIEKLPLLAIAAIFCVVTGWAQRGCITSFNEFSLWWRIGNTLISYASYLGQLFYPLGLAVAYPRLGLALPLGNVLGAFLVLVAITTTALLWRRRRPYLLVGWLWYLGTLAPVIGLVQLGSSCRADRFTYLTQIGLYIALAWGARDICRGWPYRRWVSSVTSTLVLVVLMGCAWRQTSFWRDSVTLWTHTLACTAPNSLAHENLGCALADRGQGDAAMAQYQQALKIQPNNWMAYDSIGAALADRGQLVQAMAYLQLALKLAPDFAGAHYDLANALVRSDQIELATAHYRRALEIYPDYTQAHCKLAKVLTDSGRPEEGMAHYEKALEIDPRCAEADRNLAGLLATCPDAKLRNGPRAIELAERATKLSDGKKPEMLETLAAAYAEAGRFPEASATARRALTLAVEQNNRALASVLKTRIAQYGVSKPFHQMTAPAHGPKTK
jgi:tetratricopeptide (TPR) repeat protein